MNDTELKELTSKITDIYVDHLVIEDGEACIDKWGAEKEIEALLIKTNYSTNSNSSAVRNSRITELEKAYGGCHKCYGKGYSTYRHGTSVSADFEGEVGFVTPFETHMMFCSCDRGMQLEKLVATRKV